MRTSDNASESHRFILRDAPGSQSFDATTTTVQVRAKLLASNTAPSLTIVAKGLDGHDTPTDPVGADEYTCSLPWSLLVIPEPATAVLLATCLLLAALRQQSKLPT